MGSEEKVLYKAFIIIVIILAVFITAFIISIVRYQRHNLAQYRKRLQAEIDTIETERKRIAEDLHDELGPLLAAVKLNIATISTTTKQDALTLQKSEDYLDTIIHRIREIAVNLMPSALIKKGLSKALSQYVNIVSQYNPLSISLHIDKDLELIKDHEINFYRICLEMIHNAIKHSKANNLDMHISLNQNIITLQCKDDGIGMDVNAIYENQGLGHKNIITRVESMGGECKFYSKLNQGLEIIVEIPIKK